MVHGVINKFFFLPAYRYLHIHKHTQKNAHTYGIRILMCTLVYHLH